MASKTTNYGLHKFDLTDSPPDITVINDSMDIVDGKLKELSDESKNTVKKDDYTADDVLEKIKGVDGKNSGLDADLFKGNSTIPIANGGTGATDAQGAFNNLGQRAFMGASTDVNSPNQAGCYNSNGWRQTGGAKDLPTNSYGIFENKQAGGYIKQTYGCVNSTGDFGFYVRLGTQSSIADNEWQRVYTSRNAAALIQNLLKGGSISVVKSVQRGTLSQNSALQSITTFEQGDGYNYCKYFYMDISINAVNMSKSVVSLDGLSSDWGIRLYDSKTIRIYVDGKTGDETSVNVVWWHRASWQVIEFY